MYTGYKRDKISSWRWREIHAVIMQYDERKKRIKELIKLPKGISDGTVHATGSVSNPTQDQALQIARLKAINDRIDEIIKYIHMGKIFLKGYGYTKAAAISSGSSVFTGGTSTPAVILPSRRTITPWTISATSSLIPSEALAKTMF